MNEINEQLKGISELVTRIDAKVLEITTKLDELIKALHEYDDENIQHCEYSGLPSVKMYDEDINKEYGESSFEAFKFTNDYISSLNIEEAERRMDIIGQNGNEGLHYDSHHVTNKEADDDAATFNDYGMRVVGKDKSNNPAKHTGETKKRNKRYYKPKSKQ
jgi:hypothetical protein